MMKTRFLMVLCLFISVNLMAVTVGDIRTTAVSHDGFTIRWEPVVGADSYEVEVKEGVYGIVFETGFEGLTTMPGDWVPSHIDGVGAMKYAVAAHSGEYIAYLRDQGVSLISPIYLNPREFSFWAKVSRHDADLSVNIGILDNFGEEIECRTISAVPTNQGELSQTYHEFFYTPNDLGKHKIELLLYRKIGSGIVFLDDFSIEAISPDSSTPFIDTSSNNCAIRISSDVQPETAYIYRIKPNTTGGEFSAWHVANTPAEDISSNSGSAIAGTPASINLSVGDSVHNLDIAPSSGDDADYQASVTQSLSSYNYSIQCEHNTALNAVYTISHPGFTADEVYTNTGVLDYAFFEPGISTFKISGMAAKGELTITLNLEEDTLPVTLSYFNAFVMNPTNCRIDWTSQSESNLLGYRILRGMSDQFSEALTVSALIAAQNSGSTQHYSYLDKNSEYPAYYWLAAVNMDGSEDNYGPVQVDMPSDSSPVEPDYRDQLLVFPNPMTHAATLQISTKNEQAAELRLYNMKGQLLRKEDLGTLAKGKHRLPLKCEDKDGCELSSGIYLLELRYPESVLRSKIVITE